MQLGGAARIAAGPDTSRRAMVSDSMPTQYTAPRAADDQRVDSEEDCAESRKFVLAALKVLQQEHFSLLVR